MKSITGKKTELLTITMLFLSLVAGNFSWGYIFRYGVSFCFIIRCGFRIKKVFRNYYFLFLVPNIFIFVHSLISVLVYKETFHIMRSINNFGLSCATILIAYCLFILHKERAIQNIVTALSLFFFIRAFEAIYNLGFAAFFSNIIIPGSDALSRWLELHDIGLSLGMVLIYYIFFEKRKWKLKELILPFIIFFVCFKRIAIGAFVAVFVFILLSNRTIDKKDKLMSFWGLSGVVLCFGIVYLIQNESLTTWLWQHGINVMGRDNLYRFFKPYYSFSPSYFGRGNGFTSKLLTSGISISNGHVNTIAALHSDILRVFIEYGFIGSALWYGYYLIYLPRKFVRTNRQFAEAMFACTIYAFIVYITDNTSDYFLFQLLYMLIPLCVLEKDKCKLLSREFEHGYRKNRQV